ncbi:transcriptional regulator [Rhizobium wenxiniae]|uniref:HTH-type transcriptional regulator TtuA n=1 Tax=Rhizobium wenxiniae TaxID=1737357 RepID=A0A7W9Y7S9_9HYPH|nr:LysR family transcriptional regulator [Rhizobium wenxiniae]MBB6163577.1 LysR family nitrogen assimilation transcriptional regulator [Rhizobium wenxiniae]GGG11385.1 transcriptional regulator [Rhizobium wenxiniae]
MVLDLLKMRYFAKIAEVGSFTRASRELGVAQPPLSLHMRSLEDYLGVQLLNRTSRGVILTDAGQTLFSHAQSILRAVEQAEAETRQQDLTPRGDVSLGMLSSLSPILSVPVLEICEKMFPQIRLTISEGDSQTLRATIDTHLHDLAINLVDVAKASSLPLFDERLYAVGRIGSFDDITGQMSVEDALSLPLIMPTRRHGIRVLLERQALMLGRDLNIVREIEGLASTRAAIRAGLGFAILGRGAVYTDMQQGNLAAIPLSAPVLSRRLILDMPVNHPPTRAMIEVRNILTSVIKTLGQEGHWTCLP